MPQTDFLSPSAAVIVGFERQQWPGLLTAKLTLAPFFFLANPRRPGSGFPDDTLGRDTKAGHGRLTVLERGAELAADTGAGRETWAWGMLSISAKICFT